MRKVVVGVTAASLLVAGTVAAVASVAKAAYVPPCSTSSNACEDKRIAALESKVFTAPSTTVPPTTVPPTTVATTTKPPTTTVPPTTATTATTATTTAPPATGFPTAATTGVPAGVTLAPYTGSYLIDTDGTVIDSKDIKTCLQITANNVTIKNSKIECAGTGPTDSGVMVVQQGTAYASPTGLTLTDDEITRPAGSNGGADYGVLLYGSGVKMLRVNIHNVTSGVHFSGGSVSITDSYIHDMVNISGSDHNDDVIANGYSTGVTLEHNTLEVPGTQTTPIAMYPEGQPNTYWTIDNNSLAGGGYCIYPSYSKGSEQPNNHITVTNNVFSRKFYSNCGAGGAVDDGVNGAQFSDGAGNVWSGNAFSDGTVVTP